jgi:hypothetical protein
LAGSGPLSGSSTPPSGSSALTAGSGSIGGRLNSASSSQEVLEDVTAKLAKLAKFKVVTLSKLLFVVNADFFCCF